MLTLVATIRITILTVVLTVSFKLDGATFHDISELYHKQSGIGRNIPVLHEIQLA